MLLLCNAIEPGVKMFVELIISIGCFDLFLIEFVKKVIILIEYKHHFQIHVKTNL